MKPASYFWKIEQLIEQHGLQNQSNYSACAWRNDFFSYPFFQHIPFELSENPVFEGFHGLKQCGWTIRGNKPIVVVDNHHAVLPFWDECQKVLQKPFSVVHIDAHKDNAIFPYSINKSHTAAYIAKMCRVCDYIDAAQKMNIIDRVFSVTQSSEFEMFTIPEKPFLLNLDIDIFGEEGSCVSLEKKIATITAAWKNAFAVTIATSPGFICQKEAFEIVSLFLEHANVKD